MVSRRRPIIGYRAVVYPDLGPVRSTHDEAAHDVIDLQLAQVRPGVLCVGRGHVAIVREEAPDVLAF